MIGTNSTHWRRAFQVGPLVLVAAFTVAPDARAQQVTYAKDVAPIMQAKCQNCHHVGAGAPMALTSYEETRPWARSIKTRVQNREMPPWHIDKTVGIRSYKNDISLNDKEMATIIKWVDGGAVQGNPADAPAPRTFGAEDAWHIRKPDLSCRWAASTR